MALSWQEEQEYCKHPKVDPLAFVVFRHCMTFISICITPLGVYVVKKSPAVTRVYGNLLVLLLVECGTMDVTLQWVADPTFILPLMCLYRKAPLINVPISPAVCLGAVQSLIFGAFPVYFALFVYRHQTIVPAGSRWRFSTNTVMIFLALILIPYLAIGVSFSIFKLPLQDYSLKEHLSDDWPAEVKARMECFETTNMFPYYILLFLTVGFAIIFIIAIARHTFTLLKEVRHLSAKTQQLYRILTKALIIQALTPVATILLPLALTLFTNMFLTTFSPQTMSTWTTEPLDIVFVVGSLHSATHSIALIFTTPAFRAQLFQMFPRRGQRIAIPEYIASQRSFTV